MVSRRPFLALATAVGLITTAPGFAQTPFPDPYKLVDLASYVGPPFPGSNPDRYVEYNGEVYFFAAGGLWKTNGTRSGTSFTRRLQRDRRHGRRQWQPPDRRLRPSRRGRAYV